MKGEVIELRCPTLQMEPRHFGSGVSRNIMNSQFLKVSFFSFFGSLPKLKEEIFPFSFPHPNIFPMTSARNLPTLIRKQELFHSFLLQQMPRKMLYFKINVLNIPQKEKRQQLKWIYKGLFYAWGALWALWNPLTGRLLLARLRKAPESRRSSSPSYHSPAQARPQNPTTAQHPGPTLLLLPRPHLPWTDTFNQLPETSSLWDYENGSAVESIKCSTDGKLSWLKTWSMFLCVSFAINEF